jgi:ABC-type branched-subunit amino acid transport system ATPase component
MTSPVLACDRVAVRFRGVSALNDISLQLPEGSATGLIGPNGAGKTTLVNVLTGLLAPTSGSVLVGGSKAKHWSLSHAARAGVARTFQAARVFAHRQVGDNVTLAAHRHGGDYDPLEIVNLEHRRYDRAGTLSYGELRRLGVAIALSTRPTVLLLDEPGAGLTGGELDQLSDALANVRAQGTTILLVDHNMRFVMKTVERVVVLDAGTVIAQGTPGEVQADEGVRAAYLGSNHDA